MMGASRAHSTRGRYGTVPQDDRRPRRRIVRLAELAEPSGGPEMRRTVTTLWLCGIVVGGALAQTQPAADDLSALQEAVKSLKWRDIDVAQTALLERCRALLLMSHALGEIGAADTTQADLLSEYLEQQKLGAEFAASAPLEPARLSYTDGVKIAIALLQGPLAQSSWGSELSDVPENDLTAYQQLYESICQRKWAEVAEARQEVRRMSKFLKTTGKLQDFNAWLPTELERRQRAHDKEMARRRAAYVAEGKADEQRAAELRRAREQEKTKAAAQQVDAALQTAEQTQPAAAGGGDDDDWYPGWYYGVLSNIRRGPWYRDASNVGQARARTEERVANWHAAGGHRR
jgi:hypothetical protein